MTNKRHRDAARGKAWKAPQEGTRTESEKLPENSKEKMDERLDEGVEETFPASDPVSVKITK